MFEHGAIFETAWKLVYDGSGKCILAAWARGLDEAVPFLNSQHAEIKKSTHQTVCVVSTHQKFERKESQVRSYFVGGQRGPNNPKLNL